MHENVEIWAFNNNNKIVSIFKIVISNNISINDYEDQKRANTTYDVTENRYIHVISRISL